MNRIELAGCLTQAPELRYTPSGLAILELALAGDARVGERTIPWYHRATAFSQQAERLTDHLDVGDAVFVPGRLNYRTWTNSDDSEGRALDVVADGWVESLGRGHPTVTDKKGQERLSASVNRVVVKGNLTRDPDLRTIDDGDAVLNLAVAVNDRYESKGEMKERTHFVDATAWRELARDDLGKGDPVIITGCLVVDSWTDKDDKRRFKTKVEADGLWPVVKLGQANPAPRREPETAEDFPPEEDLPF